MNKQTHTKTPWTAGRTDMQSYTGDGQVAFTNIYADDPNGKIHLGHKLPLTVARAEGSNNKANAQFIVKCVNSHDELVEALKHLILSHEQYCPQETPYSIALAEAKQTLTKAGEN